MGKASLSLACTKVAIKEQEKPIRLEMNNSIKEILWNQFGASIDMLINVILSSPADYFMANKRFYYIAFHSTIFLDYYLTIPPKDFNPMLPFTRKEAEEIPKDAIGDLIPDKMYTQQEIGDYLSTIRIKCKKLIDSLTEEKLSERFTEGTEPEDMDYPILEITLYNLRHTQHHVAQLNLLIRQDLNQHMEWAFRAEEIKITF